MILTALILILMLAGLFAWYTERFHTNWPRWISLFALGVDLILLFGGGLSSYPQYPQFNLKWIPQLGIRFQLGMDGLSFLLVSMTLILGVASVLFSWTEIKGRIGFFYFNLMWLLAGIIGVLIAFDLFIFYFFWEMMLVPMYFLIAIWGYENKNYAAIKFFIFTQASGLLMLVSIVTLVVLHGKRTSVFTFSFPQILSDVSRLGFLTPTVSLLLMLGFVIAFAVKLPVIPLHTWLPDVYAEAPTAVILAGLLLKIGAYGLLRFVLPLFPQSVAHFTPIAITLGIASILYGAVLAYAQTDLKRLLAYASVSHMGFVFLGIFVNQPLALQGVVIQLLCHGLSTGGLFIVAGAIQERIHTCELSRMGGIWSIAPRLGSAGLFFSFAALGLPGLGDFVGEFLILLGTFQVNWLAAVLASFGFVVSVIYSLWMVQAVFQGKLRNKLYVSDLSLRDLSTLGLFMVALIWLGIYPQPVIQVLQPYIQGVHRVYP